VHFLFTTGSVQDSRLTSKKVPHPSVPQFLRLCLFFFVNPFYLQSVLVHSANCVKDVYSGMWKSAQ
jgi:hypothetical protein